MYAGICLCGLEHYSRGYSTLSEAHDDILRRCKAGVVTTGHMHSFRVTQCVRTSDDDYDYRVIYQGKVQKTKIGYTLYNGTKNVYTQNINIMQPKDYYSQSELDFLHLSPEEVKSIASMCADAVTKNYHISESAVETAIKNAIGDYVKVRLTNKAGKKKDGYVCLQDWDLYGKTHCPQLLHLPIGSKAYNRINGTIKIENLENKILEVHNLGNKQLREIQGASIMDQVSDHMTQSPSVATPVTVMQTTNTSATIVDSHSEELEDAILYVDRLVRLITTYIRIADNERNLLEVKDIGSLLNLRSGKLFTATFQDTEITINATSINSSRTITLDVSEDTVYDELYCAISELLIEMSLVRHDVVSSIVKVETLADLLQTLLHKRSIGSQSTSLTDKTLEENTQDRVEPSVGNQDYKELVCNGQPYSNTFWFPHVRWD